MAFGWSKTSLPVAGSRTDDVYFVSEAVGWAVNSDGRIYFTSDGGMTWVVQTLLAASYLRCLGFSSVTNGWVGALSGPHRLYRTTDGGATWAPVTNLPPEGPARICGIFAVSDKIVFASGTNYPNEPAAVLRTTDGGVSWDVLKLGGMPALLVDIYFEDALSGWVVGAIDDVAHPGRPRQRRDVVPAVFHTSDGGETWTNQTEANTQSEEFPRGEWGWKFHKLGDTLFVSCENFLDGAFLRSDDRGASWQRLRVNDQQRNSNLEGIGFVDTQTGWVGGWGDSLFEGGFTSATEDGGQNWENAKHVGFRLNRFRFLGDPVSTGYASGDTVYKYSDPPSAPLLVGAAAEDVPDIDGFDSVSIDVDVIPNADRLTVRLWERFGREVRLLVDETDPVPGQRLIKWDFRDDSGETLPPGGFVMRIVQGATSVSRIIHRRT
ncbi:hypothetical protein GHK68_09405 [Sinorhizobium meliloti]|uniref:YCF48-related protein n=1 Tax=Rhizobium meliloti TaxID=382 RepID=UPI0012956154|nr:YCF48-related protein [Sinorhizobium meliloti]MQW42547.1 hypothetical protein [Sinorhizobium meliloti]